MPPTTSNGAPRPPGAVVDGLAALLRVTVAAASGMSPLALALAGGPVRTGALAQPQGARAVSPRPRPPVAAVATPPPPQRIDEEVPEGSETAFGLVTRAQAGDGAAFGELYDAYVDLVYRYVYYRVGSHPLAEDLTSEAFLRALRRIGSFSWQGRDFGAWLITIARNLIADHYKSGRYRLEVQVADMLDADRAEARPEGRPEDAVIEALTNATLLEAVKRLGPDQQECIVLRFLQGLSVSETAKAMGKNDGAIKALQYRAVRALGRLLPDGMAP